MIFDVALITREAEQDVCVWNSDTESFKLPARGWTESLWQPNEPKVFFLKPKWMQKQLDPLSTVSAGTAIVLPPLASPLQRKHSSPGVGLWTDVEITEMEADAIGNLSQNVIWQEFTQEKDWLWINYSPNGLKKKYPMPRYQLLGRLIHYPAQPRLANLTREHAVLRLQLLLFGFSKNSTSNWH